MLKVKKMTQIYDMKVFNDNGDYFGDIDEAVITSNKVFGWRVKATRSSVLSRMIAGAKGIIVPHRLVRAVGDIMLISRSALPQMKEEDEQAVTEQANGEILN